MRAPTNLLFVDCETVECESDDETRGKIHLLRLGVARACRIENGVVGRRAECRFTDCESFWKFVHSRVRTHSTLYVFAHNASFDLQVLRLGCEIESGNLLFDSKPFGDSFGRRRERDAIKQGAIVCLDGPPIIISMRTKTGVKVWFLDSLNYMNVALETLGRRTGKHKLPMPSLDAPDSDWFEYCSRDCEILETAMIEWFSFCRLSLRNTFAFTAAAQSKKYFSRTNGAQRIHYHYHEDVRKLERAAYYGGIVRCFYIGRVLAPEYMKDDVQQKNGCMPLLAARGPVYHLDVTGLFPSVMFHKHYPVEFVSMIKRETIEYGARINNPEYSVAEVMIRSELADYSRRVNDRRVDSRGEFRTVLCGEELARACSNGHVVGVGNHVVYECAPVFHDFVNDLWNKRYHAKMNGNLFVDFACKIIMNALYGKFGERGRIWQDCVNVAAPFDWGVWNEIDAETMKTAKYRAIGGHVQRLVENDNKEGTFVAISAFVAAAARERMRQIVEIAGIENVYHIAIDSIVCNKYGYRKLLDFGIIDFHGLGFLRLVNVHDDAEFWGANDYRLGSVYCRAGISSSARMIGERIWKQPEFEKIESAITRSPSLGVSTTDKIIDKSKAVHNRRLVNEMWPRSSEMH